MREEDVGDKLRLQRADAHGVALAGIRGEAAARDVLARHERQHLAGVHRGGAAEKPAAVGIRQADEHKHIQPRGGFCDLLQRCRRPVEEHPVPDKVIARAARERKLREDEHLHARRVRRFHAVDNARSVIARIRDLYDRGGRRNLNKSVFHCLFQPLFSIKSIDQNLMRSAI